MLRFETTSNRAEGKVVSIPRLRLRMRSKSNMTRAIVEERIAKANHSSQQKQDLSELKPGIDVDLLSYTGAQGL